MFCVYSIFLFLIPVKTSADGCDSGFHALDPGGAFDPGTECPEHALKIYKTDQQFKYLLVHQDTRAEEVVKLALHEFGINELKSNYSLYEVTVKVCTFYY